MSSDSSEPRYWLSAGDIPTGPLSLSEIHAKLASGDVTWQTSICAVGENTWRPIFQTQGLGSATAIAIGQPGRGNEGGRHAPGPPERPAAHGDMSPAYKAFRLFLLWPARVAFFVLLFLYLMGLVFG